MKGTLLREHRAEEVWKASRAPGSRLYVTGIDAVVCLFTLSSPASDLFASNGYLPPMAEGYQDSRDRRDQTRRPDDRPSRHGKRPERTGGSSRQLGSEYDHRQQRTSGRSDRDCTEQGSRPSKSSRQSYPGRRRTKRSSLNVNGLRLDTPGLPRVCQLPEWYQPKYAHRADKKSLQTYREFLGRSLERGQRRVEAASGEKPKLSTSSNLSSKELKNKIDQLVEEVRVDEEIRSSLATEVQNSTAEILPSGVPKTKATLDVAQLMIKNLKKNTELTALRAQLSALNPRSDKASRPVDLESSYNYFGFERYSKESPTKWTKVQYPHIQESVWRAMMGMNDVVLHPAVITTYHTRFPGKHILSRCLPQMSPELFRALTSLSGSNGVSLMAHQVR